MQRSSGLLALPIVDATHRTPLSKGKAWGHHSGCGYARAQSRDINAAGRLHTQITSETYGYNPR